MNYLVKIKYYYKYEQDGYYHKVFSSYEDFTNWLINYYKDIVVLEIEKEFI